MNNKTKNLTHGALIAALRVSAEGQEGLTAFLEKRPATWATSEKDAHV